VMNPTLCMFLNQETGECDLLSTHKEKSIQCHTIAKIHCFHKRGRVSRIKTHSCGGKMYPMKLDGERVYVCADCGARQYPDLLNRIFGRI